MTLVEDGSQDRIGEQLVRLGVMSAAQVERVLAQQAAGDHRRFGEIAIALDCIDEDALRRAVMTGAGQPVTGSTARQCSGKAPP